MHINSLLTRCSSHINSLLRCTSQVREEIEGLYEEEVSKAMKKQKPLEQVAEMKKFEKMVLDIRQDALDLAAELEKEEDVS